MWVRCLGRLMISDNTQWDKALLERPQRWRCLNTQGSTLWFTGLSGSGKSTIAKALEACLVREGVWAFRLDGDNLRHGLNEDLGFSEQDRRENIRRSSQVARLFAECGCVVLASLISPLALDRQMAAQIHAAVDLPFIEIFVDTPLACCEKRDPKGLYAKARRGDILSFTGVDAPYEAPKNPDLHLNGAEDSVEHCVQRCLALLKSRGLVPERLSGEAPS
jgi:adenylyl-sulfate kinase